MPGTGNSAGPSSTSSEMPTSAPLVPRSYRFVLKSSCGERGLLGRYSVVVRDGRIASVTNLNDDYPYQPDVAEVPTLEGLVEKAKSASPDAVVDLEFDDAGLPRSLMIDHVPGGVDDEECYEVSELTLLT